MATPGSPGSSSEDMDYDYFDDDNAEDLSYSDLEVFPGRSQFQLFVENGTLGILQ